MDQIVIYEMHELLHFKHIVTVLFKELIVIGKKN